MNYQLFLRDFLLFLLVFGLWGCQNQGSVSQREVVTLAGWQSNLIEQRLLQESLEKFSVKYPQIQVKYEVITGEYMPVLYTRLAGGTAPDVFYLDALEAPRLMAEGALESLDNYVKAGDNVKDFAGVFYGLFQYEGHLYGLPKDFSTLALFYNKSAFKGVGLKQPPESWEALLSYSKKLTLDENNDGNIERYGLGITPDLARQVFIIEACEAGLVDENGKASFATPAGLKGLQLVVEQYRKDRSSGQPSDVGASSANEMFGTGNAAMVLEGMWAIPFLKDSFPNLDFGVAEVPKVCNRKGTMAFTVAYVMNRQSRHQKAAWLLMNYLTSKESMKALAGTGFALPTRESILAGFEENVLYAPFVAGASYATVWQGGVRLPKILTSFNNQFISALLGQQSLNSAMTQAQKTANKDCLTP